MGGGAMLTPPVAGGVASGTGGAATTNHNHLHSVSQPPLANLPGSANCISPLRPFCSHNKFVENLTRLDTREDQRASGSHHGSVLGPVPTRTEVDKAISDLQRFMLGFCTSEFEWLQQMLYPRNVRMVKSSGHGRVDDAFRLLQTDPLVQRMVTSISTDKVVWDAILNNNAVLNLRESLGAAKEDMPESSTSEEPDLATLLLNWILEITKAKVLELIEQFISLVNIIFQPPGAKKVAAEITDDQLDDKLRSSVLLSIVVILIVVVTRAHGA
ncbi:hypothetical protein Acr_00g0040590 [Actinidia rufa]|uniref:Uncharacterized protein n=1 Tax=Actinidia rufa TaxID=165716 RepID=A0A7J0DHS5_9ERIC|nr:hypothetical protein Acr_00g0040590 [Actinidia rufa]